MYPFFRSNFVKTALLGGVLCQGIVVAFAQSDPKPSSTTPLPRNRVAFRNSGIDLKDSQKSLNAKLNSEETERDVDNLVDQKRTVESEIQYEKSKLEEARKRLALKAAVGRPEEADVAEQAVKDWEGRLKASQAQLAQIEDELRSAVDTAKTDQPGGELIVPGENLEVFIVEDATYNGRYQVRRGGYIILPQVGRIYVAGKKIEEAEAAVRKALMATQLRKASVMLERIQAGDIESGPVIYLAGEFKSARPFRIPPSVTPTLVGVILSSGGVTDKADLTRVRVMRVASLKGLVEEVNVQRILDGAGLTSDVSLNDGDVVMVPTGSASVIYLTGRVKRQGALPMRPGEKLNAYAAILQTGGFDRFANERAVYVLRSMPDGTKQKIRVNISDIKRGRSPDVPLQSNDIIIVPEKFFSL